MSLACKPGAWCWLLPLLAGLIVLSASPAKADVGIVAQLPPNAPITSVPRNAAAVSTVEQSLDRVGIGHRRLNASLLSDRTLRPFDVVILPEVRLADGGVEALRQFSERGGHWVAYLASGSPAFDALLGVRAVPPVPPAAELRFLVPTTRLGMPVKLPLPTGALPRPVEAINPAHTAGRWNVSYTPAPLVRGPFGYYANLPPGEGPEHAEALLSMLGDLEPNFWIESLSATRENALREIREATLRWTALRSRTDLPAPQRSRIDSALQGLRTRVPQVEALPAEVESNRILLAGRVRTALDLQDGAQRLVHQMSTPRKGEVRGVRIDPTARQDWDALMRKIREAGFNAVFVRMGEAGSAFYPSEVVTTAEWARGGKDELAAALEAAKKQGLAFHVIRSSFTLANAPAAFLSRMTSDDRLVREPSGKQGPYLNPGDPRNTELEYQAILELIRKYDVDGFQFDSVRYPDDPHTDWDYGQVSRREFEKAKSVVERWPEDVLSGSRRRDYDDWQRDTLNRFVQRLAAELKRVKPHLLVSAAVEADQPLARASVKQDWAVWIQQGWVDFLVPLNFTPGNDVLAAHLDTQVNTTRGRIPLLAGLGAHVLPRTADLIQQVDISRELGADGFVIAGWTPSTLDAGLAALRVSTTAEGTWLSYLAPHAEWTITPSTPFNRMPLTLAAGDRGQIEVKVVNVPTGRFTLKGSSAEIRLEDPSGRFLGIIGGLNGFGVRKSRFEAPAGRFRPVLRGNMALADGSIRPFVIRGPICNGVTPDELAALRAQDTPPTITGPGRKVAVYAQSAGAPQLLDVFHAAQNVNVFPLYRLQADHLARVEVLILPPLVDTGDLSQPAVQALRDWVSNGGMLLLLGDAVGARWHPRLFPEVGVGKTSRGSAPIQAVKAIGSLKPGEPALEHPSDHVRLAPATGAEVLLIEAGETEAVVSATAQVGKGRVILCGKAPGSSGEPVSELERELLRALITPR